jgi:hypothetical protein
VTVRSEYRRKWDRNAAQAQDVWEQELAPTQSAPQPLQQPRQPEPVVVPWADEIAENERQRYAATVSAPPSRSVDSYSYSPPRMKPSDIKLSAEQADMARRCGIDYQTYAENLLAMEERKRRGDMQQ